MIIRNDQLFVKTDQLLDKQYHLLDKMTIMLKRIGYSLILQSLLLMAIVLNK